MRTPSFLAAAALRAAACLVLAGPAGALTISGRVLKGEERVPTPGISVSLHVVRGESELPGRRTVSGTGGAFRFAGLGDDPGLQYFLSVEYEGSFYTEGPLETSGRAEAVRDMVIYDVGRDIGAIQVTNHHIIVERHDEALQITEVMIIENAGSTAYLGTGMNHAENVGIRLGLPASVKRFEAGMGGDDQTVRVQGRDLSSSRPIPPGTHPFSFSYEVPLSGRMDLSHRLYFPTKKFVILIGDPSLKLESKSLHAGGPREQGGRTFELYEGSDFPVGADVEMKIGGASFLSNPKVYPWLAAPFVIAAVLVFARRQGRRLAAPAVGRDGGFEAPPGPRLAPEPTGRAGAAPMAPAPGPPAHRAAAGGDDLHRVYLYLIAQLDQGLERGEFSRETHAMVRGNLKRRLETILSDQPRTGTR